MRKVVKKTQPSKEICLKALIDIKQWQRIQDNFSAITNVGLRILDTNAQEITKPSGEPRLCSVLLKNSSLKGSVCGPCLPTFLGGDALVDKNLSTVCKLVLHNFIVPLRVDFLVLGYLIMGPVILVARKPKEEYRKAADELSLRIDDLWSALLEIKVLSFHTAQSIMELVKDVAEYMLRTSYESTVRAKTIIMQESEKIDKLLNELLAVALQVSGANIGSIMLLNKKEKELSIKTAKGIPDNIVRNTRVKIGRGSPAQQQSRGEASFWMIICLKTGLNATLTGQA